ncbi:hypothetical protein KRR26_09195 [Corallococcus sp. M34]|uniref:adventurous gliding motility protein AgmC n=1 Tax=Citreicoccus inhibens TaxID=2849499 RepID=UPI001C23A960|nr:hypothetical protein [Citreicoccus inhibens]MBU8895779.1 hypothetical protein [Citreicoccus inhibens]
MRIALVITLVCLHAGLALAEPDSFGLGTGRDGSLTVSTPDVVINTAFAAISTDAVAGATGVRLSTVAGFAVGDLVLFHQTTEPTWAAPVGTSSLDLGPRNLGQWELARVGKVDTTVRRMTLTAPLRFGFQVGGQVVRVPEYKDVTVTASGSLVAPPWKAPTGGILAFVVSGTLSNAGRVHADGKGFEGGSQRDHSTGPLGCTGLNLSFEAGGTERGEGVATRGTGRGNVANGGGGANCNNAGGGGGGHGGVGGAGGRTAEKDGRRNEGGLGGASLTYTLYDHFLFGGGGGAGEGDQTQGTGGERGGGAVFTRASLFVGSGTYSANGAAPAFTTGSDGAGGGGAGGTVILRSATQLNCGSAQANGGQGGDITPFASELLGAGGGGAGGRLLLQGTTVTCSSSVQAGRGGLSVISDGGVDMAAPFATDVAPYVGTAQPLLIPFRVLVTPVVVAPREGSLVLNPLPRIDGTADVVGPVVYVSVDGVRLSAVVPDSSGRFSVTPRQPLPPGEHLVEVFSEVLGMGSAPATPVRFTTPVMLSDGGVVVAPVLVVPATGDTVSPTPLFAGTATNGASVGLDIDDEPEVVLSMDLEGRFRYARPGDQPMTPGPHRARVHAHDENGNNGPSSSATTFEVVVAQVDGGSGPPPDAGNGGTPDAGGGVDAGTQPDAGVRDPLAPVLVLPEQGEVVDPTPLFAGVAVVGASVALELDGVALATVTTDDAGVFRHEVSANQALALGDHRVVARTVETQGVAGARSSAVDFQVRGPTALDVGCGCGATPLDGLAGAGAWLGLLALARRRARRG